MAFLICEKGMVSTANRLGALPGRFVSNKGEGRKVVKRATAWTIAKPGRIITAVWHRGVVNRWSQKDQLGT